MALWSSMVGYGLTSARPSAGIAGRLYYSTDDVVLYRDNGSSWDTVGVGSALSNPMTTQDDLVVGGASGVPARLAKGSDGQVLTVDPSTHHLVWATPSSGNSFSDAEGDPAPTALTAADGTSTYAARRDHVHTVGTLVVKRKTADETVNNSTTLQNDDHLTFTIGASEIWAFWGMLALTTPSSATPDLKADFDIPSGGNVRSTFIGPQLGVTDATNTQMYSNHIDSGGVHTIGITTGGQIGVLFSGVARNGATPGSVRLRWAQNSAASENTTIRTDSFLVAMRIA
jgi:hypothetical protein